MVEAGARVTYQAPLAWLAMEADDTDQDGAEVSPTVCPQASSLILGGQIFTVAGFGGPHRSGPRRLGPRHSARHSPWDVFGNDRALTSLKKPVHPSLHKPDQSRPDNHTDGAPLKCLKKNPQ